MFPRNSKKKKAHTFLCLMDNAEFHAAVWFLSDVFHHLNLLNTELQGRDKTVAQLVERLQAFQKRLALFSADLCSGKMLLPPALRTAGLQTTEAMTGLINALKTNFATRCENFSIPTEVMRFVNDPFCVDVVGEFAVKAKELYNWNSFSHQLTCDSHYSWQVQKSSGLVKSATRNSLIQGVLHFLSSLCLAQLTSESAFSHMNAIKTSNRASLTAEHLHHCMHIAMTSYTPDFTALAKSNKCHFSH